MSKEKLMRLLMWLLLLPVFPLAFGVVPGEGDGNGGDSGDDDGGDGGDDGGDGGKTEVKTYTEDQVNAIVQKRLAREAKKYADYDDLKAAADELSELKKADLSEVERLEKELADAQTDSAKREIDLREREMAVNERLIRAEVRRTAVDLGFIDPDEAYMLADLSEVAIDDDDTVSNVEKALKKLSKDRPHLLKSDGDGGGTGTPPRGGKRGGKAKVPTPKVSF